MKFKDRLQHAWSAFRNNDIRMSYHVGPSSYNRPDRVRLSSRNEKTISTAVLNRIALDVAAITIQHVKLDENNRYQDTIYSGLNDCLTVEANKDQTSRAFIQDVVLSLFDEGCVAIVPVDTTLNPIVTGSYDINSMRAGRITSWYPDYVRVELYNDHKARKEQVVLPKSMVAIVENPFYAVMNESNSTYKRLINKLHILDAIDEQSGSGKLDLIIKLPYAIKSDARRIEAEKRRKSLEDQLSNTKFGIGYVDSTEQITQLNRSVENNLMGQIEYLNKLFYSQLGITESIMNGTANEAEMSNYMSRTVEPIISCIVDEMKRKFLTKTARTQRQSIMFFREPFKLVPVSSIADIADKFTRNEIMSSNEFRQIIGLKLSKDPNADALRNKNMPVQKQMPGQEESVPDEFEGAPEDSKWNQEDWR